MLRSKIFNDFPEIDLNNLLLGIFSRRITIDTVVKEGDRIEIYRPLLIDPKEKRRLKAKRSKKR